MRSREPSQTREGINNSTTGVAIRRGLLGARCGSCVCIIVSSWVTCQVALRPAIGQFTRCQLGERDAAELLIGHGRSPNPWSGLARGSRPSLRPTRRAGQPAQRTMTLPAELLYSLPFDCPFEFPRFPSYPVAPVVPAEVTLRSAYLDALYNPNVRPASPSCRLASFHYCTS